MAVIYREGGVFCFIYRVFLYFLFCLVSIELYTRNTRPFFFFFFLASFCVLCSRRPSFARRLCCGGGGSEFMVGVSHVVCVLS